MNHDASPSRRLHITRLPSSSLLGLSEHQRAAAVRIVSLSLRVPHSVSALLQNEPATPSTVTWDLYQTVQEEPTYILVARNCLEPDTVLSDPHALEQKLAAWLGKSSALLSRPYTSVRGAAIVTAGSGLASSEDAEPGSEASSRGSSSASSRAEAVVVYETLAVRQGDLFASFCSQQLGASPELFAAAVKEELQVDIGYLVMRDLDDSDTFRALYFFRTGDECVKVRESAAWKGWRAAVAPHLIGPATVTQLRRLHRSGQTSRKQLPPARRLSSRLAHHDPPQILETAEGREVAERAVGHDDKLRPFQKFLRSRFETYQDLSRQIRQGLSEGTEPPLLAEESLINFANGAYEFGLVRIGVDEYRVREYLPGATDVFIYGEFNGWDRHSHKLLREENGVFSLIIKTDKLRHLQRYKLIILCQNQGGEPTVLEKPCPFSKLTWKSDLNETFDSVVYQPDEPFIFNYPRPSRSEQPDETLRIYEVNVGLCSEAPRFGTYMDCMEQVLPRMTALGLNTVLLSGVMSHSYFPSGGWHVNGFFAPTSLFGSPDDLKKLVDRSHALGIRVVVSVVVSHAGPSECDGLAKLDGTETAGGLFKEGSSRLETNWDGVIFDYSASFGRKFMLSVLRYWIEEFRVDGFRFEGLSSVLYKDHALNGGFDRFQYSGYFEGSNPDLHNQAFLMVATDLVHSLDRHAVCIASDVTQTPTLALPICEGGVGFDFVLSHHVPQAISKMVEQVDSGFSLSAFRFELDRLSTEKRVAAVETLDTLVIGKRPMKVAFFAWETLHTIAVGGIAPHVTELAAGLRRAGHEVHVFTRAVGMQSSVSVHFGVFYHQVTFDLNRDFVQECQNMCNAFVNHMLGWERETGESFAIVHGHDWLAGRAVCALKGLGRTCVFTMHSTESGRCGNRIFDGDSARIRHIEREACMVADRVICVSGVLAEEVKSQYGVEGAKIRVVYNGCNAQNFDGFEVAGPIKERYGISPMEPTILFVGRFVVQKGVDLLIEALPSVLRCRGDCRFVIVGDGHMRGEVERRANELRVAHACRFVGAKGGAELVSLYKMCDAVIVPSRNEPFGIVVLEAWSAYKPVIATTCGGPRDFVTPGVDGYLVDPNPNSIAWGICKLLENFDHARYMGERGRVKAAFSFSWDTIARQTRDIYYELINKSDAAYCVTGRGDCSLAQRTMKETIYHHMGIFDDNDMIRRGLSLLKIAYLLTVTLAGEASLIPFGSEFAHPDWIDFPRAGNNFSHQYARRLWSLGLRKELKYKHVLHFYAMLNRVDIALQLMQSTKSIYVSKCDEADRVLAFERGDKCLVVVNLHPERSFDGYGIGHALPGSGKLRHVLDTDQLRFGGYGRLESSFGAEIPPCDEPVDPNRPKAVKLYLPSRSALIVTTDELFLQKFPDFTTDRVATETPDDFIDSLVTHHPHLSAPV